MARVRLVAKGESEFVVLLEVGSGKGKRVLTGRRVPKEGVKAEARRMVQEHRGEPPGEGLM